MALGSVATGEQRAWFLAVGLTDNTVRIISLDPAVSINQSISFLLNAFNVIYYDDSRTPLNVCDYISLKMRYS